MAKEKNINASIDENMTLADYETKIEQTVTGTGEQIMVDKDEYKKYKGVEYYE